MEYRLYTGDMYKYHLLWDNGTKSIAQNTVKECFIEGLTRHTPISSWYLEDPICIIESFEDLEERYPELLI